MIYVELILLLIRLLEYVFIIDLVMIKYLSLTSFKIKEKENAKGKGKKMIFYK